MTQEPSKTPPPAQEAGGGAKDALRPAQEAPGPVQTPGPTGLSAARMVFGGGKTAPTPTAPVAQEVSAKPEDTAKAKGTRTYKPLPQLDAEAEDVPPFETYFASRIAEIMIVQKLLEQVLSDNPALLTRQMQECEAHYGRMTSILAWADSYLDLAERRCLVERDSDYTDMDRQIHLAAAVSRERRFRDVVDGLKRSIEQRVSVCQSLLKSYQVESRMGT